jgi:hypothetical protein
VHRVAADLSARREASVLPAFLSASEPRIDRVVGNGMAVATYLLAPGYFYDRLVALKELGAGPVTAALAPDESVAQIAVRRYLDTLAEWSSLDSASQETFPRRTNNYST